MFSRLGEIWSNMTSEQKDVYFRKSKQEEREHFQRYPGWKDSSNMTFMNCSPYSCHKFDLYEPVRQKTYTFGHVRPTKIQISLRIRAV